MNSAATVATLIAALLAALGVILKGASNVIKHIAELLAELKNNTTAIKNVGAKLDNNFSSIQLTVTDHEKRITQLEDKVNSS